MAPSIGSPWNARVAAAPHEDRFVASIKARLRRSRRLRPGGRTDPDHGARAADEIVVRAGETLTSISREHGVSIERLVQLNAIANPSRIYAGQRLRLESGPADAAAPSKPAAAPAGPRTHTVRSGEHLTGIARHYGVTIAEVVAANRIADASRIYAGQRLTIPGAAPAAAAPPAPAAPSKPAAAPAGPRTHTVRSGEHLTGIARHYGVTIAEVVAANRIADASRIYAGQRLTIPGAAHAAPAGARAAMPATMAELVSRRRARCAG
jgi:N-acetylmuramoyl-L-alanine amidase